MPHAPPSTCGGVLAPRRDSSLQRLCSPGGQSAVDRPRYEEERAVVQACRPPSPPNGAPVVRGAFTWLHGSRVPGRVAAGRTSRKPWSRLDLL